MPVPPELPLLPELWLPDFFIFLEELPEPLFDAPEPLALAPVEPELEVDAEPEVAPGPAVEPVPEPDVVGVPPPAFEPVAAPDVEPEPPERPAFLLLPPPCCATTEPARNKATESIAIVFFMIERLDCCT